MTSWALRELKPPLDYRGMSLTALLETWSARRNSLEGLMCAEEVCRRMSSNTKSRPELEPYLEK